MTTRLDTLVIEALNELLSSGQKYNKLYLLGVIKEIKELNFSHHIREIELQATIDKIIKSNPGTYDEIWNTNSVSVKTIINIGPLKNTDKVKSS